MSEQKVGLTSAGFKTSAVVIGTIMAVMWTLAFILAQVLPSLFDATKVVNYPFYFLVLVIIFVMTLALMLLHVVYRLVYAMEQFIK